MGKDQGLFSIGPFSKKGVALGIILGACVLTLSIVLIAYTDSLFMASLFWIVLVPFIFWVVKKMRRSGKPPSQGGDDDGG